MTREQEQAIEVLEEVKMLDDSIYQYNHTYLETLDIAIQAIKDLDKMNGIALDLASENDDLIEKLDSIRAEIIDKYMTATGEVNTVARGCLQIIDKYKSESEVEE